MNQQSDQRALAELQVTKEANAREQSELETQLAAALASSQGMVAVDNELGQHPVSSVYFTSTHLCCAEVSCARKSLSAPEQLHPMDQAECVESRLLPWTA
jgi:hypothetical protein